MLRLGLIVGFVVLLGSPAHAAPPAPTRADLVARALQEDPVQVTDTEPRALGPDAHDAIVRALKPLGFRYYVVVQPSGLYAEEIARPDDFISLLHDRLNKPGLYLVTDPDGTGSVRLFGGSAPVEDAWRAASRELPYDAPLLDHVDRFAEILSAPDVPARVAAATEAPERHYESDDDDRVETTAFGVGTLLGALAVLFAIWRRPRPRRRPGGRPSGKRHSGGRSGKTASKRKTGGRA